MYIKMKGKEWVEGGKLTVNSMQQRPMDDAVVDFVSVVLVLR